MTELTGALIGLALALAFVGFIVWRKKVSKTAQAKKGNGGSVGGGGGSGGTTHQN